MTLPPLPNASALRSRLRRRLAATLLLTAAGSHAALPQSPQPALIPDTTLRGPALELDFPSLHIGTAEYVEGPTGATVFYFPAKAKIAVDQRGGAPGTMNTDYLRLGYDEAVMDAVVFSGGSWYGLSAGTGVAEGIKEMRSDAGSWQGIAGVVSAIIFDLGDRRDNTITPDAALGKAALKSARPGRFPLGAQGAGRMAKQGVYFAGKNLMPGWPSSGQGGAFRTVGKTKIAFFTVVNALGTIVDRDGRVVRCGRTDAERDCGTINDLLERATQHSVDSAGGQHRPGPSENTTISLLVTNQKLAFADLERLAIQVHTSMARAIQPLATEQDGDVLYAATTDEVDNADLGVTDLGVIAAEVAWDAILSSVPGP
jgi:L-aminopeptidase/D-esterase-like protein